MVKKATQRAATETALLAALEAELASGARLAVEPIAARAVVNKALVYRYFGGLPGLLSAFASSDRFMPSCEELMRLSPPDLAGMDARQRFAACVAAYVRALSQRPATVHILLRLGSLDEEATATIAQARARGRTEVEEAFGLGDMHPGFDPDVAFNMLLAGACYLLSSSRSSWRGKPVRDEELTDTIVRTISAIVVPG